MERGSDRISPREDDQRKHETAAIEEGAPVEPRVEEFREQEPAGDDQPTADARLRGGRATAASLDLDEAEARSELAKWLAPGVFPADREALLAEATARQAPPAALRLLERLDAGIRFPNVQAVWHALGGHDEQRF